MNTTQAPSWIAGQNGEERKKDVLPFSTEFTCLLIQTNDLHFVIVLLDETAQSQTKPFVRPYAPIHWI